jgi:histidinol-phosphatase (PHP family)
MADDSHGIEQVGTNYRRLLQFIQKAGIPDIYVVQCVAESGSNQRSGDAQFSSLSISQLESHRFWAKHP